MRLIGVWELKNVCGPRPFECSLKTVSFYDWKALTISAVQNEINIFEKKNPHFRIELI